MTLLKSLVSKHAKVYKTMVNTYLILNTQYL